MCYIDYTFSCCTCNCCDDGCCNCCADCDPLVCCCLEIRLVSKADSPRRNPNAATYLVKNQSIEKTGEKLPNNNNKTKVTSDKVNNAQNIRIKTDQVEQSAQLSKNVNANMNSGQLLKTRNSGNKSRHQVSNKMTTKKTSQRNRPSTKMKSDLANISEDRKSVTSTGARSLPKKPPKGLTPKFSTNVSSSDAADDSDRTSSDSSDEDMVEIPVKQQTSHLHSNLYKKAQLQGRIHSHPDHFLDFSQSDQCGSDALSVCASSGNPINNSSVSLRPDLVLNSSRSRSHRDGSISARSIAPSTYRDGSFSHRSVVSGSNISVHFEGQHKTGSMSLTSPRPLPGPPMR
ncbi:hypothetical protein ACF0H5_016979 [Mactra antiquata]